MNVESVSMMTDVQRPMAIVHPLHPSNCHPQLSQKEKVVVNPFGILSYEGLPKGSNPAHILRCLQLLEHVTRCGNGRNKCSEGEGCQRTKQVLLHHLSCKDMKREGKDDCNICRQLLALYRNHSYRCQACKGNCAVPYCKNNNQKAISNLNKTQLSRPTTDRSRKECQYVIKKLSEAMELPTKLQKLRAIEHLLQTYRQTTQRIIGYILGKKQKSLSVPSSQKMKNLTIERGLKTYLDNSPQPMENSLLWPPAVHSIYKQAITNPSLGLTVEQSTFIEL